MPRTRIVICVLTCVCISIAAWAAERPSAKAANSGDVIYGAKTPEKIADVVAWRMLFKTIADGPGTPEYAVRAGVVRGAGFTDEEIQSVIAAANDAMSRIRQMEVNVNQMSGGADVSETLRAQRDAILKDVVADLMTRLTPAASTKFQDFVQNHVKRGITVTP